MNSIVLRNILKVIVGTFVIISMLALLVVGFIVGPIFATNSDFGIFSIGFVFFLPLIAFLICRMIAIVFLKCKQIISPLVMNGESVRYIEPTPEYLTLKMVIHLVCAVLSLGMAIWSFFALSIVSIIGMAMNLIVIFVYLLLFFTAKGDKQILLNEKTKTN